MTLDINETDLATLNAQGYTEQDLSMLAKSEIAALLDVPADDSGTSASDPHAAAAAEQEAAAAAAPKVEVEQVPRETFVPQYSAEVPADAKEQIAALTTEERTAFKQLMAGEIEADAYQEIRDRTEVAKDELKTKALTASIFEQANTQGEIRQKDGSDVDAPLTKQAYTNSVDALFACLHGGQNRGNEE